MDQGDNAEYLRKKLANITLKDELGPSTADLSKSYKYFDEIFLSRCGKRRYRTLKGSVLKKVNPRNVSTGENNYY